HKDEPVRMRFLTLAPDTLLAVFTEKDPSTGAMYAIAIRVMNGAWVFRTVELAPDRRDRALREALMRHGATDVAFDRSDVHDQIKGPLTAANLRMLFADADFRRAITTDKGFRLSPKISRPEQVAGSM